MATATVESVAAAAEALQAAGKRVTTIAVQSHLGGGSFTTVQKYLEAWQQTQREQRATVVDVPGVVVERGMAMVRQVWQAAQAEAGQEVAQTRQETEALLAEMREQLDEALLAVQRQEAVNADQIQALAAQAERIAALQAERDEARTDVRITAAQVEALAERVQDLQTRLDAQTSVSLELAQLQGAHGALQRQVEEQRETIRRLSEQRQAKQPDQGPE